MGVDNADPVEAGESFASMVFFFQYITRNVLICYKSCAPAHYRLVSGLRERIAR